MADVWNAKIVGYRSKPIISLYEELRCYIMRRMAAHQRILGTVRGKIAPAQQKKLDQLKVLSNSWTPTWTGNLNQDIYEVSGKGERLAGLPCEHAIAAICHKNEPAELYVHQWLTVDALHATYAHTLNPVNSDKYWPTSTEPKPIPPPLKRPIGRPKKHRKKDPSEEHGSNTKRAGHYAKTCKGPAASKKGKRPAAPSTPVTVNIPSRPGEELPLSQGGPPLPSSQAAEESIRGNNSPPSAPPPPRSFVQ
ncbi:uncharacterized protein LOC133314825 [Gastrolobium bilobum]|uniref:uncharacterized protein LOC133314825 n=1 Tax=Gastrolobium bilobum TaxID=150636 RepID=UPI002AB2DE28|nr:uncharacterized protein LOC133314825 [Gastrolobium bilobum]